MAALVRREFHHGLVACLFAVLVVGCGGGVAPDPFSDAWVTVPEFQIGDAVEGDALFTWVPYLRATEDGRVFVLEPNIGRLSVWTWEGAPVLSVGKSGQGPGEFIMPYRVYVGEEGFQVRDQQRFTFFAPDGALIETVSDPPTSVSFQGFRIDAGSIVDPGGFLGYPQVPGHIQAGSAGSTPLDRIPILYLSATNGQWTTTTVFRLNQRNSILWAKGPGLPGLFTSQPFGDNDLHYFDMAIGTVVVVRRNVGMGRIELLELEATGDTVWQRTLVFPPLRLAEQRFDATVDELAGLVVRRSVDAPGTTGISLEQARNLLAEAIHAPQYLPAASHFRLASSGEVWLQGWEQGDTLRAWYSLERGDMTSQPRKVLVPRWFQVLDATENHVWGVWRDAAGVPYVVGRRVTSPKP